MFAETQKDLNKAIRNNVDEITIYGDLADKVFVRHVREFNSIIPSPLTAMLLLHPISKYSYYEIISYEKGKLVIGKKNYFRR